MNKILILIIIIINLIILITSYFSKYWQTEDNNLVKKNVGLWQYCINNGLNEPICKNNDVTPFSLTCVKIFSFLSIILIISSIILMLKFPNNKRNYVLCLLIAGVFSFSSSLIFISDKNTKPILNEKLGYSWYLQLLGSLLSIIIGILLYTYNIDYTNNKEYTIPEPNPVPLPNPIPLPNVNQTMKSKIDISKYIDDIDVSI